MNTNPQRPGFLQRARWSLTGALGIENGRRGRDSISVLDDLERWLEYQGPAAWEADAENLRRFGHRTAGDEATSLAADIRDEIAVLRSGLPRTFSSAAAERWDQLRVDLDHLKERRRRAESARTRMLQLVAEHLEAQRRVWQELEDCDVCVRAEVLAEELDKAPDLTGLEKPDLAFYTQARAQVDTLLGDGSTVASGISFNPEEAQQAVTELRRQAAEAERLANLYFHQALRGYEEALGPEETNRLTGMLKDPFAMRRLRQQHSEVFRQEMARGGMADVLPMLMMFSLFSAHSDSWGAPTPSAEAAGAGEPGVNEWLAGHGVPPAEAIWETSGGNTSFGFDSAGFLDTGGGYDFGGDSGGGDFGGGDFGGGGGGGDL